MVKWRELAVALRRAFASNEAYAAIDASPKTRGTTPTAGACWPVATAIRAWLGHGQLAAIFDVTGMVQHVVVELDGRYIDADGVSSKPALLRRWQTREGVAAPWVARLPPTAPGLVCPARVVTALRQHLGATLGPAAAWGIDAPRRRNPETPGTEEVERLREYLDLAHRDDRVKARDLLDCCAWAMPMAEIGQRALTHAASDSVRTELRDWLAGDERYVSDLSNDAIDALVAAVDPDDHAVFEKLSRLEPQDIPTWFYLQPRGVSEGWLLHFSDAADTIAANGFERGVQDPSRLGLTVYLSEDERDAPGYNFAYHIDDVPRYAYDRSRSKYGKHAVLFYAPYLSAWHHSDEEPQAIFWGPAAQHIVRVYGSPGSWWVTDDDGEDHEFEDLDAVAEWAERASPNPSPSVRRRRIHNVPPPRGFARRRLFHGTPSPEAGEAILESGLILPRSETGVQTSGSGWTEPVADRVYVTTSREQALRYALSWAPGAAPHAYLFEVDASAVKDVEPDEDSLGELAYAAVHGCSNSEYGPRILPYFACAKWEAKEWSAFTEAVREALGKSDWDRLHLAQTVATRARIGKKLLAGLSEDWRRRLLKLWGAVSLRGAVPILGAWQIPLEDERGRRLSSYDIDRRFAKLARPVPVSPRRKVKAKVKAKAKAKAKANPLRSEVLSW